MTGSDLIVLAPWLVFAVGLAVVCLLLLRSSRASGSRRSFRTSRMFRTSRAFRAFRARRSRRPRRRHDPQELRCRENNAQARPR
jgi:hypothetical protein